jgi:hypothetical protein
MGKQITVPDVLYDSLNEIAKRKRKKVDDIAEQFLNNAISEENINTNPRMKLEKAKTRLRRAWKTNLLQDNPIDEEEVDFLSELAKSSVDDQQRATQAYEEVTKKRQGS